MAKVRFDIPKFKQAVGVRIDDALKLIGGAAVGWAADQWRANGYSPATRLKDRSGFLVNSLTYSTDKYQGPLNGAPTTGKQLRLADKEHTLHVGSTMEYAARVEFGFTGKDSLGRYFNQKAKSYLRAGILTKRGIIVAIMKRAVRGKS